MTDICCICPPACDTDHSGDTCIAANCGRCLWGCPASNRADCCGAAQRPADDGDALS